MHEVTTFKNFLEITNDADFETAIRRYRGTAKKDKSGKLDYLDTPETIEQGGQLVLVYSSSIHNNNVIPYMDREGIGEPPQFPLNGTILLHGLFFAHEDEPSLKVTTGVKDSYYENPDTREEIPLELLRNPEI